MADIKWNEAGLDKTKEGIVEFLNKFANEVKDDAKDKAPVLTGKLRDSIQVNDGENDLTKYVETDVPYAIYQEMGTVKIPPKAFLRRGLADVLGRMFGG